MVVRLSPLAGAGWQFFDNSGVMLSGGKIYTYAAGSTTPLATYTSSTGSVTNANPIVLDSTGRTSEEVWLIDGSSYKFEIKTSTGTLIKTCDNITGINDSGGISSVITGVAGETLIVGDIVRSSAGLMYKVDNTTAAGVTNFIGVVTIGGAAGDTVTITRFEYSGYVGLTPSAACYIGLSGALTQVKPTTYPKTIGFAKNATTLVITEMGEENTTFSSINVRNTSTLTGAVTASSTLGVTGLTTVTGIKKAVVTKTTTYTATTSDHTILCSGSAFTVNLPACSGNTGLELVIVKTDSSLTNIITIDPNGAETVNGSATTTLNTQYESVTLVCDGSSNWVIQNRVIPEYTVTGTNTIGATTSNPTKGTPITDRLWGRRSGKFWEFQIMFEQAPVGTVGSGDYLFTVVPSGVVINTSDSSVYPITVPGDVENSYVIPFGSAFVDSIGVSAIFASPILYDTSKIRLLSIGSYYVRNGYYDFAGRILYSVTGKVPISGWNS